MKTSQKQNILRHLLYGPLCGQERDWTLGNRIPARIHELRSVGFKIGKRECDQGHDHRTYQIEFYLKESFSGVSPHIMLHADWCAHCGSAGTLRHADGPLRLPVGGCAYRLPVACDKCGKGDWR